MRRSPEQPFTEFPPAHAIRCLYCKTIHWESIKLCIIKMLPVRAGTDNISFEKRTQKLVAVSVAFQQLKPIFGHHQGHSFFHWSTELQNTGSMRVCLVLPVLPSLPFLQSAYQIFREQAQICSQAMIFRKPNMNMQIILTQSQNLCYAVAQRVFLMYKNKYIFLACLNICGGKRHARSLYVFLDWVVRVDLFIFLILLQPLFLYLYKVQPKHPPTQAFYIKSLKPSD